MLTLLLSGAMLLASQQAAPAPQQQPQTVFRSGVDRVAVDVVVVDEDGRPVSDLTAADFVLDVDGRRREIASAQFISLRRLVDPGPPPSHYSSNTLGRGGRLIMLVVDQNNIRAGTGRAVFDAAAKFIAGLDPSDRVGLHFIPSAGPVLDFTSNHALVSQMLKQAVGHAPSMPHGVKVGISEAKAILRGDQSTLREVLERECAGNMSQDEMLLCQRLVNNDARSIGGEMRARTAETLVGLRELMRRLRAGRTRKIIVMLSEGLVLDQGIQDLGWVPSTAAASQATLYVLQMESSPFEAGSARVSPSRSADRALEQEGLELLAGLAGGAVVPLSPSNPWLGFSRVSTEASGYYLLSFEPEAAERDGRTHKIRIQVQRRGLTVRARREFAMDAAAGAGALAPRLGEALQSPVDLTGIPIEVSPYVLRDETGRLKVIIASEVDRTLGPPADAAMGFMLVDRDGRVAGSDMEPSLGAHDGRAEHFASALIVDPGLYSLRFAVADASGRDGSVGHVFDAKLHAAGQLRWSDLVLSERDPASGKLRLLTAGPSSGTLQLYLELYSDVPGLAEGAAARVEIARRDEGLTLAGAPIVFSAAPTPGRRTGEASIDVGLLGDGEFIARAIVMSGGKEAGRVLRPFTIKTRQP
ncbi:MAG TPA: VWA domain-containing protein [Vicinamibacterales bacterium]